MIRAMVWISRTIWLLWLFALVWELLLGEGGIERFTRVWAILQIIAVLLGNATMWSRTAVLRMMAATAGLAAAGVMLLQYWVLTSMFSGFPEYRLNLGPLHLEGAFARFVSIALPTLMIGASAYILWRSADEIDRRNSSAKRGKS